ncbi:MAG: tRNA epoxyqueuosine(34) reductase QueG, partial [Gammaproteobacteria bacterium]|nr:tRNA epoxyqueuosine(34) reductase QueG [Gammaproteobacteria bacterium]
STIENNYAKWIDAGMHGDMDYMHKHGSKRLRPDELIAGTKRVISVRMDHLPHNEQAAIDLLDDGKTAYVSRYALGRDYHKVLRKRLQKLAKKIQSEIGDFGYRVFVDSAPVMEKPLAQKAGLGWQGKHTNLINKNSGSWFFLGELYTDLPLPIDEPAQDHCGSCTACLDVCPTNAIIGPYQLDARKCISYLTIEHKGSIPIEFRKAIGNRIYGCDDCQLFCPWNKFAQISREADFMPRHDLDNSTLVELFNWSEETFLQKTEGSAIRRIGYERWLRNLAIGLGNANKTEEVIIALQNRVNHPSEIIKESVNWALNNLLSTISENSTNTNSIL